MSPYDHKTLKTVEPVDCVGPQKGSGGVRDLKFSPDGKWLAASFANEITEVWTVGNGFTQHGLFATQAAGITWSPDSRYILAQQKEGVVIWSPD
ncbi:hypothetical protein FRC00_014675, partial [Tulasnella sp. 408]